MLRPVTFDGFAGFDLDAGVQANVALAHENLEVRSADRVATRPGSVRHNAVALAGTAIRVFQQPSGLGSGRVLAFLTHSTSGMARVAVVRDSGVIDSSTSYNGSPEEPSVATAAHGGTLYEYFTCGSTTLARTGLQRIGTGTPIALPAAPDCYHVARWQDRLAHGKGFSTAGPADTISGLDYMHFSKPFAAETYDPLDRLQLATDANGINALVSWRDYLFAFGGDRFFVFYGISTDSVGGAIFNYRTVDVGLGASFHGACAGEDGVYFINETGVYRTTGGPPTKISRALDPLFRRGYYVTVSPFSKARAFGGTGVGTARLLWERNRLYLSLDIFGTYVWSRESDAWTWWNPVATSYALRTGHQELIYCGGLAYLHQITQGQVTDDSSAPIVGKYRSSFSDLGKPGLKTVRTLSVEGEGTMTASLSHDLRPGFAQSGVLAGPVGVAGPTRRQLRKAVRGHSFSWQVEGPAPWTLDRVELGLSERARSSAVAERGR